MSSVPSHASDGTPATPSALAALRLTERWADAARAQSIYPAGHQRVAAALEAWREALELARAQAGNVSLQAVFTGQGLVAQETLFDVPEDSGLLWLRERLDHAALAGLVVLPAAGPASLQAFDHRLLELFARLEPVSDVAEAWARGDWPGLRLLDRRFEGVFDGEALDARETQRTWGGRGGSSPDREADERLVEALMGDRVLVARLQRLGAARGSSGSRQSGAGGEGEARKILATLTRMLPPRATQDEAHARTIVGHLVDALEARQGDSLSGPALAALLKAPELERRAAWLCTTLLREDVAPDNAARVRAAAPKGPQGHAGDEHIHEDIEEFLSELAGLPASGTEADAGFESPAEELGVLLHLLLQREQPAPIRGLLPRLGALLEGCEAERLGVLRSVLSAAAQRADAVLVPQGLARLLDALRGLGRLELLRDCGFLTVERVIEGFPESFGDWLAGLHPQRTEHQQALQEVLTTLGPERLAAHAGELAGGSGLAPVDVAARLLALRLPELAPLARLWLLGGGMEQRAAVTSWLRSVHLPDREAQVLEMVEDPNTLPDALLLGLIERVEGRPLPPAATELGVEALVQFVRGSAGRPDRRARRLEALRQLGRYDHPAALAMLRGVVGSRRWMVVPVEDRVARQVAADTLRRRGAA